MPPSYEELAALVSVLSVQLTEQSTLLSEQSKLIEAMRVELAALRRAAACSSSSAPRTPSRAQSSVRMVGSSSLPASIEPHASIEPTTAYRRRSSSDTPTA